MALEPAKTPLPLRSPLLGSISTIEVSQVDGGDAGRSFFFEERYFVQSYGITDGVNYRKRSRRDEYLPNIRDEWDLSDFDVTGLGGSTETTRFTCFSSPFLLAWMYSKFRQFLQGRVARMANIVEATTRAYHDMATKQVCKS